MILYVPGALGYRAADAGDRTLSILRRVRWSGVGCGLRDRRERRVVPNL